MYDTLLAQCEREPLHLSGAIQPHGSLLVVNAEGIVTHASANIAEHLGQAPAHWIGNRLPWQFAELLNRFARHSSRRVGLPNDFNMAEPLEVVASQGDNQSITLEFFHALAAGEPPGGDNPVALHTEGALDPGLETITDRVARLTGFHRVMLYIFQDNGDGEVVEETRQGGVYGSYLGLRYPASDIPAIARQLYLKNPWRLIPDAERDPVPILSVGQDAPDLTYSDLRSVSPVHRIYLRNMEVRASLSFPILTAGSLFALVACHHRSPRQPSLKILERAANAVNHYALTVTSLRFQKSTELMNGFVDRFGAVRDIIAQNSELPVTWQQMAPWLLREFACDGAALCLDDQYLTAGMPMESHAIAWLDQWVINQPEIRVWLADNLSRAIPDFPPSVIAGTLALHIRRRGKPGLRLYLYRTEHVYEVAWGGNPDKPVEFNETGLDIAPRRSFEKWVEKRLGYSRPWDQHARILLLKLRELLVAHPL